MGELKHSVAGIARKGNAYFIARRLPGGALSECWEFPGGKVEEGESDEAALIREYREEFDVSVRVGRRLAAAEFEHRGIKRVLAAYEIFFEKEDFKLLNHSEWRWEGALRIAELDFADSDRKLFPALEGFC